MSEVLRVVNYGLPYAGLKTVGYTIYGNTGEIVSARKSTGVVELGTLTGIYQAVVSMSDDAKVVVWDTGQDLPRYAVEDTQAAINAVVDDSGNIRIILNTLRNQSDLFIKIIKRLDKLEEELKECGDAIGKTHKGLTKEDLASALKITINPPKVNVPEVHIPDYTLRINQIKKILGDIQKLVIDLPKSMPKQTADNEASKIDHIILLLNKIKQNPSLPNKSEMDEAKSEIQKDIDNLKDFIESKGAIMAFGHKR